MEVNNVSQGNKAELDNYIKLKEVPKVDKKDALEEEKYSIEKIKKAIKELDKFLVEEKTHAEYSVHEKLGDIMIKIINDDTNEVVMEVPSKKILDLVAKLCEDAGIILDKKA
ncbi:flagellar protein FlaG [Clostridium cavendishii DSM 21758]|uniref:Flagellar protein FlaG n=1 Tax=Clostridium cavendishii DSM 21758 TaxID=1121302 RepID=A0A1M6B2H3_9CLOT|nr:flagellar protein FlaG [Clostridium cavendishii]SHI42944.1 flagellar protein FlaG [Clostridium cavendishii DSM 21758]